MPANDPAAAALLREASAAMQRGDHAWAVLRLRQAAALDPAALEIQLHIALACRAAGDLAGGLAALDAVLARDPKHFVALLSKGSLIEAAAGARQAVATYRNALRLAPPTERLPPGLAEAVRHANEVLEQDKLTLHAHMREQTTALRDSFAGEALDRFDESLDVFAGIATAPVQRPLLLRYSRMPAIPFYDRALFPFLPELEAATPIIAEELRGVLQTAPETFAPYVQYPPGVPVNQWGDLNHSRRWSSYFLWQDGTRHEAACARCPQTAALMDRLPLMHQPGFAPTVVFSALEPHTHIPPHTGSANTRLLCHLPLILPGPARFRVGPQTRDWRMGEAWVFDDTIEHEAWNDADEMRVILIIDLWNPFLSEAERALITAMMTARNSYYAGGG
jgi:aspartyl/asparaginyl beta-hydroxylase (cupin superfamily)